jgi:thiamine pyrophosphokinase
MYDLASQIKFDPSTAVETAVTEYGTKFNQTINIVGANGKKIDVVFAWIQNNDEFIRLITGIPTESK